MYFTFCMRCIKFAVSHINNYACFIKFALANSGRGVVKIAKMKLVVAIVLKNMKHALVVIVWQRILC